MGIASEIVPEEDFVGVESKILFESEKNDIENIVITAQITMTGTSIFKFNLK